MMPAMRLHHAGVSVADLDAMVAWYGAALGLAVEDRFEVPDAGLRGAMMAAPGALRVELLERAGSEPVARDLSSPPAALLVRGWGHIALEVEDLDGTFARLVEAGAAVVWDPRPAPVPGMRMAYLRDPEDNLIELVAPG